MAAASLEFSSVTDPPMELMNEVEALKTAYHQRGEVAVSTDTECDSVTINVTPNLCPYSIKFTVTNEYPVKAPKIELQKVSPGVDGLAEESLQCILQRLYQTAQKCLGEQMTIVLSDKFLKLLHQELGKSDNLAHQKSKKADDLPFPEGFVPDISLEEDEVKPRKRAKMKKKQRMAGDSGVVNTKKPPMKTATDVIHRIMWDECLNQDDFIVGYMDRFVGIIEQPFSLFEWGDIAEADLLALAVPRHRIQHFKYKDVIVWDKTQRLDDVFGSTGSGTTIRDVVKKFEKENAHLEEEEEISDSDVDMSIETLFEVDSDKEYAGSQVVGPDSKPGKKQKKKPQRPTHFLAVRVTAPELVGNIQKLQTEICNSDDEMLPKACITPEKLHVTLCVMRLENQEEVDLAAKVVKDLEYEMAVHFSPVTLFQFRTVECWQRRVVVSPVAGPEKDTLQKGVETICHRLKEAGVKIKDDRRAFNPHLTILKLKLWMQKKKKYKIEDGLIEPHEDTVLGCQDVDEILLCSMAEKPRADGFYHTIENICTTLE